MQREDIMCRLGGAIKTARIERHLTQKELAKRLSISSHYLMALENKQQIPSCDLLFRIIRELEISANTLFYPEYEHDHALVGKLRWRKKEVLDAYHNVLHPTPKAEEKIGEKPQKKKSLDIEL